MRKYKKGEKETNILYHADDGALIIVECTWAVEAVRKVRKVREQTTRTEKTAGCAKTTIWGNKNIDIEAKSILYKTALKHITTNTPETGPDTTKTTRLL